MTNGPTSRRFTSFAAMGEALNPAARNDTPDCSAQDDSAEHDQRATDTADDAAESHAEATATTNFQDAFGDVGALSMVELGGERQELDMPEPIEAQHDCAAIMATLFDLFRDTRLEASAQSIAWGFVNSFHYEAQKLEREEDRLCAELSDMTRRMDPSEIFAVEMEELQLRAQTKTEQRAAIECMRDYAADCYRAQTGHPWSPARGSKVSSGGTASQIAAIDFLKARATDHREKRNPTGPLVVFSGGQEWHDWQQLWAKLDQIKARVPHMTLCTTAQRKGADAIAASWAASRDVTLIAFTPNTARYGKRAGFVRNEQLANLNPVEAVVCQGSGLQSNLLQVLKAARIPTHAFRIDGQAPAPVATQRAAFG
ncbi:DUF2493 domain-containing protein [Sphingomonas sp. RRHST34]|uniref:DUF2493 domain-containing protein n=1 Tax=Sphingomonas citri TaxID=2862499 RepID=A0ABS7BSM5_9SPHN|nr:DUF2493 domain-containing protein [Sphingomonas citri]MBW6532608.1 DUF2493 domain-containing protein [Sphingomonas citri]